ncbi:MAG: hypothetical protein Kow0032_08550 [Methyloligellaceae bacterium]
MYSIFNVFAKYSSVALACTTIVATQLSATEIKNRRADQFSLSDATQSSRTSDRAQLLERRIKVLEERAHAAEKRAERAEKKARAAERRALAAERRVRSKQTTGSRSNSDYNATLRAAHERLNRELLRAAGRR